MKTKLFFSALLSFSFCLLSSQVPQGFNYQAIARNSSGIPITNQVIPVRISIVTALTGGTVIWQEDHSSVTADQFGMISLVIGTGTQTGGSAASFSAIDWSAQTLFLKTEVKYPGTDWTTMGTSQIWAVPYSLLAKNVAPLSKLGITGTTTDMEEALFEVKNQAGNTVFAVYNEGIRAYVGNGDAKGKRGGFSVGGYDATKGSGTIYDLLTLSTDSARLYFDSNPTLKGARGGFSVGGYDMTKGDVRNYLDISNDSVRIYVDSNPLTKGKKGGFSVGGYDMTKGGIPIQSYLDVSKDSVRIYIDSDPLTKNKKGGFAVGGYDMTKGTNDNYLNVNTDATDIIKPVNRILWYPIKNAFLAGNIRIGTPDSVGVNSFATGYQSKSRGMYSQAMGFKAIANGDYSTAIGKNAVANNINSFAFGEGAFANNSESYAIGKGAVASGYRSFAFGSAGVDQGGHVTDVASALGDYSFAIGQGSKSIGKGSFCIGLADTAYGSYSTALGYKTSTGDYYSTAIGYLSKANGMYSIAMGCNTVATGPGSVSIGYTTQAIGGPSTALGYNTQANAPYSTAMGYNTIANGWESTAMGNGTLASQSASTAMGNGTIASGYNSLAMGYKTTAPSYCETAIGVYNTAYTPGSTYSWWSSDRVFVIGNGTSSSAPSDAFTVLKSGYVGIGTATPLARLDILGGNYDINSFEGDLRIGNGTYRLKVGVATGGTGAGDVRINAVGGTNRLIIGGGGYDILCLNTTNALPYTDNYSSLGTSANRWKIVYAVNGTINTSDGRLKNNIQELHYGLESILELKPVCFTWKDDESGQRRIGLIAQDVEKVISEVVDKGTDTAQTLGINYSEMVPVLIKAIQEQQKEINELKALVNTLIANQTAQVNK